MESEIVLGELAGLAEQIKAECQACIRSMNRSFEHAMRVGELLHQAKVLVKHGDWTRWVEEHCEFTPRTARSYIRLWRHQDYLKTETISDMTLRDALDSVSYQVREINDGAFKHHVKVRKERKERWTLENEHDQVKQYLDAVKGFRKEIHDAVGVAEFGKFSPEGVRFAMRRHDALRQELDNLDAVLLKLLDGA